MKEKATSNLFKLYNKSSLHFKNKTKEEETPPNFFKLYNKSMLHFKENK